MGKYSQLLHGEKPLSQAELDARQQEANRYAAFNIYIAQGQFNDARNVFPEKTDSEIKNSCLEMIAQYDHVIKQFREFVKVLP